MSFKKMVLKIIKFYQKFISPFFGKNCRFWPSCSQYTSLAIERYGIFKGLFLSLKRILKCHPFNSGGINLP